MNSATMLEIFVSLSVQVTVLIGFTAWVTSRHAYRATADACWSMLHMSVLLLIAAAFMFPHMRWMTWADLQPSTDDGSRNQLSISAAMDLTGARRAFAGPRSLAGNMP